MKDWIKQIQFVKQIATHLLIPRKTNYQQDFLFYKLSKNNHLKHTNFKTQNEFKQLLNATLIKHTQQSNNTCVIFLHGYGSNKQQGFTLVDYLPKQLDLCCFDFSSSGKSQGTINTYGLKQFRDIRAIINKLKQQQFGYKKFVLWGRSMGAVASFLMMCSQQNIDKKLKKDVIFQVLDSPFSSFQSICSYQGKQSFKLPGPFISYGIEILKSYFQDHQYHLNPFNIDLIKVSKQCTTNTLFVYSQKDDMIPKENSLQIIQQLPESTSYEKLLISENHNTLRLNQTNQQVFKIITKNYLKHLYNLQKNSFTQSRNINKKPLNIQLNLSQRFLNKNESQIYIHRKNNMSTVHIQNNLTEETVQKSNQKQPIKREKKYLELLSSVQNTSKKPFKRRPQIKPISIDFTQIHAYRNLTTKGNKHFQSINNIPQQPQDITDIFEHKNTMNSINSYQNIHKLRRSNTFDFPDNENILKANDSQTTKKSKNIESNLSTAIKLNDIQQCERLNSKNKKRALYCSLNKKDTANKIIFKSSHKFQQSQRID